MSQGNQSFKILDHANVIDVVKVGDAYFESEDFTDFSAPNAKVVIMVPLLCEVTGGTAGTIVRYDGSCWYSGRWGDKITNEQFVGLLESKVRPLLKDRLDDPEHHSL